MEDWIMFFIQMTCLFSVIGLIKGLMYQNNILIRVTGTLLCTAGIIFITYIAMYISYILLFSHFGTFATFMPIISSVLVLAIIVLNIWQLFKKKARAVISISLAGAIGLFSVGVIGYVIYDDSLPINTSEGEMSLHRYEPFAENTRAADLGEDSTLKLSEKTAVFNEESMLKLTEKLPVLDGATALYPLYSSFARATYPRGDYNVYDVKHIEDTDRIIAKSAVICQSTDEAFTSLINGDTDIAFLMGISEEQQERADALGVELTLTPIGREAFVFFVNKRNKIDGVSSEDIRRIYTGEATNWKEVGGGNAAIRAYQRPEGSGSQTRLIEIMDGKQVIAPDTEVYSSMMGMYEVVAGYKNYKNSLGYSFLYYIRDMAGHNKIKFLAIDGVTPTYETIASGEYPFINDFYAVTVSNRSDLDPEKAENIEKFLLWIQSEQGQSLVAKTGYVPLS